MNTAVRNEPFFRYIYDCGSKSGGFALEDSIAAYAKSLGPKKIVDALFLSHIDADHVNGLHSLFTTHGVDAKHIFLPLLTPVDRLLSLARGGLEISNFAAEMVIDPKAALSNVSSARIVTVQSSGEPSRDPEGEPVYDLALGNDDNALDNMPRAEVFGPPDIWSDGGAGDITMGDSAVIRIGKRFPELSWLLGFYVEQTQLDLSLLFLDELADRLDVDSSDIESASPEDIRNWMTDEESSAAIRDSYSAKTVKAVTNRTSLVVISGPAEPDGNRENVQLGNSEFWNRTGTWLLTGDADMRRKSEVRRLSDHFGARIMDIDVLALPHHGSSRSFCAALMQIAGKPISIAFASAGTSYKKHPAESVIKDVTAASTIPWIVTESSPTRISATWDSHSKWTPQRSSKTLGDLPLWYEAMP